MVDIKDSQGVNSKICPDNLPYPQINNISFLNCERATKKAYNAIYNAKRSAAVWIWFGNELSSHNESHSLGLLILQVPLFWAYFIQIWAVLKSFKCARLFQTKYQAIFVTWYLRMLILSWWSRTKPIYPSVEVSHKESQRYCILEQITSLKAYLQTKSNKKWMDGARISFKRTQASISTVTVAASHEILLTPVLN